MTTIVWDKKTLAADGRETINNTIILREDCQKIVPFKFRFGDEKITHIAAQGSSADLTFFMEFVISHGWETRRNKKFFEEFSENIDDSNNFAALLMGESRMYLFHGDGEYNNVTHSIVVMGSGLEAALTALKLGMGSAEAVKTAALVDCGTNDNVTEITPYFIGV